MSKSMDRIAQCPAFTCQSKQKKSTVTMFSSTKHDQGSSIKQFMSGSHHPKRKEENLFTAPSTNQAALLCS